MDGLAPPLSIQDALRDAYGAGFRGAQLVLCIAIAMAESSLIPNNRNVNTDGSVDRGVMQVNNFWHKEYSDQCCDDPPCAFKAAYAISSGGKDFTPWSTYKAGDHLRFLNEVWVAAAGMGYVLTPHLDRPFALQPGDASYSALVTQSFGLTAVGEEPAGYLWPDGSVTYHDHDATARRCAHLHAGTDYAIVKRQLRAPADGTVLSAELDTTGFGLALRIHHPGAGVRTLCAHLTSISVTAGQTVRRGDPVAISGGGNGDQRDGNSTGFHLHFGAQRDSDLHWVDVYPYVNAPIPKPAPPPDPVQLASFIVTAVNDGHPVRSYDGPSTKLTPRETWEPGSSMAIDATMIGEERGTPGSGHRDARWYHLVAGAWVSATRVTGQTPVSEPHNSA